MISVRKWTIRQMVLRVESLFAAGFVLVCLSALRDGGRWQSYLPEAVAGIVLLVLAMIAYGAVAADSEKKARAGMKIALTLSVIWCLGMLVWMVRPFLLA